MGNHRSHALGGVCAVNVSIIIATYGSEDWRALAMSRAYPSALDQGAHEIVVGHDPEGTIAGVRNALTRKAEGDWLCFLDADDELAPGYLGAMERAYEQESGADGTPLLLTPAVQRKRKNGQIMGRPSFFDRDIPLTDDNWLVLGTLVQRDLFMQAGGFSDYPHGFEDWSLWAKCWKAGAQVVKVPEAIYVYWLNPNSKHKQGWRNHRWQVETHERIRKELFPEMA